MNNQLPMLKPFALCLQLAFLAFSTLAQPVTDPIGKHAEGTRDWALDGGQQRRRTDLREAIRTQREGEQKPDMQSEDSLRMTAAERAELRQQLREQQRARP